MVSFCFKIYFLILFIPMCCVSAGVCNVWAGTCVVSPGVGVLGHHELPDMGVGNQTWVMWRNSKLS